MTQLGHKDQKPNSILCTHTSYHASGILKETILCHPKHENAHTSKIVWPRCTKGKTCVQETIPLPFSQESCAILTIKSNFLFHELSS